MLGDNPSLQNYWQKKQKNKKTQQVAKESL